MLTPSEVERIWIHPGATDAAAGRMVWSPAKSLWIFAMHGTAIVGGILTFTLDAMLLGLVFTGLTLCLGHSLGMHRLLIHRSYACPRWLEYLLVHFGVIVGLAGPLGMMRAHDTRDWAQRQGRCHDFFSQHGGFWRDGWWQLHCEVKLDRPPSFVPEARVAADPVYRFMQRTWMAQQLPWAVLFFILGGLPWLVWGVAVRVLLGTTGHWLIGWFAHNRGPRTWHVEGAGVQGYDVRFCALLTMGESWHNSHHAYPGSARIGLEPGQWDPGYWLLLGLRRVGLVWDLKLPEDLPPRPQLRRLAA